MYCSTGWNGTLQLSLQANDLSKKKRKPWNCAHVGPFPPGPRLKTQVPMMDSYVQFAGVSAAARARSATKAATIISAQQLANGSKFPFLRYIFVGCAPFQCRLRTGTGMKSLVSTIWLIGYLDFSGSRRPPGLGGACCALYAPRSPKKQRF